MMTAVAPKKIEDLLSPQLCTIQPQTQNATQQQQQQQQQEGTGGDNFFFPKTIVAQRFRVIQKIGSGGFGAIFKAFDPLEKTHVAVKVEKREGKSYLEKEVQFYKKLQGAFRLAKAKEHVVSTAILCCMACLVCPGVYGQELMAVTKFSLKTVLMLADQLVTLLERLHNRGIVHRDVKPGNFVMGLGKNEKSVYIIDFGLSNHWRLASGAHIAFSDECAFRGTHRYASINSHFKKEQSRRDDLEALGYVLIYFLKGSLPWQSLKVPRHKRRKSIGKYKERVSIAELTKGLPIEFAKFLDYVKNLQFEQTPDYDHLRGLFRTCFEKHAFTYDYIYDWTPPPKNNTTASTSISVSDDSPTTLARPSATSLSPNDQNVVLAPTRMLPPSTSLPATHTPSSLSLATAPPSATSTPSMTPFSGYHPSPGIVATPRLHINHFSPLGSCSGVMHSNPAPTEIIEVSSDDDEVVAQPANVTVVPSPSHQFLQQPSAVHNPSSPTYRAPEFEPVPIQQQFLCPSPATITPLPCFTDICDESGAILPSVCSTPSLPATSSSPSRTSQLSWSTCTVSSVLPGSPQSLGPTLPCPNSPFVSTSADVVINQVSQDIDEQPSRPKRKRADTCEIDDDDGGEVAESAPKRRSTRLRVKKAN